MFSHYRWTWLLFLVCLVALPVSLFLGSGRKDSAAPAATFKRVPRLAVLVIFDQMRGDYLSRWQRLFGPGGFRRLQTEGAWYPDCHYPYADTVTAAGHASVLTGCSPAVHGIIANDWYDRASGENVGCVAFSRYTRVPPPTTEITLTSSGKKELAGCSPERLLTPTLADVLKEATGGKARVVSLSLKDRAAVLPAGRKPDACYWFDPTAGIFVTSTYYRNRLHRWVAEFNRDRPADHWFGQTWQRLLPNLDYVRYSGPDDVIGEGTGFRQGRCFPHPMTAGLKAPGKLYYQALANSPFGNELLLKLAERALDAEHLGAGDVPDLLCLSFSSNDIVGHCWGPDSQEVLDVTLRADEIVQKLLAHLDSTVGNGRYVLVLTADHGVCPLPEVARAQGKEAGRVSGPLLAANAEAFLNQRFGQKGGSDRWLDSRADLSLYLNRRLLSARGLQSVEVEDALAGWLKKQPDVLTAYTRTQLLKGLPEDDDIGGRVRRSFHPERSGDVAVVLKPYHLLALPLLTGTNHGSPHPYDTHVPLLVYGPGINRGTQEGSITPQATAAILARALGIRPPSRAEAPVPEGLFTSADSP